MRGFAFLCFLVFATCLAGYAQQPDSGVVVNDSVRIRPRFTGPLPFLDSVARASALRQQYVSDSLNMVYIVAPDPTRPNMFVDSILKTDAYKGMQYLDLSTSRSKNIQGYGHTRPSRDAWVIVIIILLLLFSSAINITASKDMSNIFQSFYNRRNAMQAGKEDSPINAWTFIGLFLLFGFTFGVFLYLLTTGFYKVYYTISGFQLFATLSIVIILLFATKFLVLKFLGFVFDINKLVSEYISTLSLTYFNITFVLLPVALCFSLIAEKFIPYLLAITLLLVVVIFIWQYLRSSVSIISNFRFHKFYLFVYLCALEICPILILIKALNIGFR
ncbi:DUF4271 domain-containing protein [Mucilaginibacter glaciei]|uniref:DUF4271 domain-containing protein n=1 Tax=Mucilaginibacter glaciei TaxID=2772109 RepID=A0A926NUD7_9SPHI|nr:DUF4271 domain-containing protein [Mucilaginibacter glaciei]MBD1395463.1 DUF4271 domain-containing protein [Mucilaginibacter glaciei]